LRLHWQLTGNAAARWVLQFRTNQVWTTEILPGARTNWAFVQPAPDLISVGAVDRAENLGAPAAIRKYRRVPVGKGTYIWR
jgi:hypothetical protein